MNRRPLEGIRVLEISAYISGPYAAAILAALGAEVVKVEPLDGEAFRRGEGANNPYFFQYNAGKKSLAIDLKSGDGIKAIEALVPHFDVLIENMRPGKLAALGLGEDDCRRINPGLVYASISGFGNGGPLVDRPAYDSIGQSFGGLYSVMNDTNVPRLTGTCVADLITAITSAMGILASLVGRERDPERRGVLMETSIHEAVSALTIDAMTQAFESGEDPVRESRHPQAQNFCLRTAAGQPITLHLSVSEKFWRTLLRAIEREDLLDDVRFNRYGERAKPENFAVIKEIMEAEFAKRSTSEWEERLTREGVPFAPVLSMSEVAVHPQTEWLQLLQRDVNGHTLVRLPWRFDGNRPPRTEAAPEIGEHTREVLRDVCSEDQVNDLVSRGVVAAHGDR
ncbi:CaiB/BaiF CoA transferase family protein [Burkholderia territorii]|uniref:CaiB/BaiF CoA transferase family protein n=1 Tax=Burkholderia territorii TaxID=1503055 RepID=UPI000753BA9E|nr:CoA transferase [Burkholderia territorii]KVQ63021.1 CoA-transferase [Burkholderia territorii]